jgi:7-carboxy-7-deazaguanine synthase
MSYAVKEIFLTLQGEGMQAGRRAVFLRFAGCNLWSGREEDRAKAVCQFCDTDFVGTDGDGGGKFADAGALADAALVMWGEAPTRPFIVITGGEPMLQIDDEVIAALHARGFEVAMESNGTLPAHPGIDWVCISPKAGSEVVQRSGNELKLVWPQPGSDVDAMEDWAFDHFLIQPLDDANAAANHRACIDFVMARPKWRLSVQAHKYLGLR